MLIPQTGDCPVQRIGESRHDKHDERLSKSAIHKQPDEAGNQENTEDGQAVGDIHILRDTTADGSGGR
jgi:hypothetical protein